MSSPVAASPAPGSLIGQRVPRQDIWRLLRGRGRYLGDIKLPRMLHLAFVRSPYAHAAIRGIDAERAAHAAGVVRFFTGADLAAWCKPFAGVAQNRPGHKSAPQFPMAVDRAYWHGQPVAAVVAESRAQAEDAADLIAIDWEELAPVLDGQAALAPGAPVLHDGLADNQVYQHIIRTGDPEQAFAASPVVVEHTFNFFRQTGLTLEPRGLIADFDPGAEALTVWHSHQSPHQMQGVFSRHLGIPEHKVRVIAPDVGGGFGLKINVYAEEVAVAAISRMIGRPVKFCADRLESFLGDIHVRDHGITARMACGTDGRITAMSVDDVSSVGAYGMYLRFNIAESMMLVTNTGAAYDFANYAARTRNAFVNKSLIGMYRGVGIPLSTVVTEVLADMAAARLGIDPAAFRKLNYRGPEAMPCVSAGGNKLDNLHFGACHDRLVAAMDYERLREEQRSLRARGVCRGIGIATYVEPTAYGPAYYGPTGAPISVQDGCTVRLEPSGVLRCISSITDQGQGTLASIAQIVAATVGVDIADVEITGGDSAATAYGGGAWASRGIVYGGEAALRAARELNANIRAIAAAMTQASPDDLRIAGGQVINMRTDVTVATLADIGRIGYFRQDTLPRDLDIQLSVTKSYVPNDHSYYMTVGVQGSHVEIDLDTGFIKVLGHWSVTDCGRVINPLIVDGQLRGGIVQGIGAVLYEEIRYNELGCVVNGTMAEYLAPMAGEMPDIHVEYIETAERSSELGVKGAGEAGLIGAMGALWVSVNDALRQVGARISDQPFTPERILDALQSAAALRKLSGGGRDGSIT
jgi:carbon-monoxide dehydrogenase large subunit